jgi:hypothetical protein
MGKLRLPHISLICITGRHNELKQHEEAIDKSSTGIEWGASKVVYDPRIKNIDDWNKAVLYDLWRHVGTEFGLLIHPDGYVINPSAWRWEYMDYDYTGAPWPVPHEADRISYRTATGELVRQGNSVSLRSRRIMELPTRLNLPFTPFHGNTNEDGKLCVEWRDILKAEGIKYAPVELAAHFSKEHVVEENKDIKETFCFHTVDL